MRIKKIYLKNIRSYEEEEIEFPNGSTLLSGDIGSGKTSVLLGIEFSLFGLQPGQRGASLLRNNAKEGTVKIELDIDGKDIIIERTLKKSGKSITQDYCSITIDGEKKEISVTELKNLVLTLLAYPLEFSKKQNLLYRFTVYTPQEEMKQIILQDAETRLDTLRHVFGVDKYKKILENASLVASKLREEKRRKEGMVEGLEQKRGVLKEKEEEIETRRLNLSSMETELFTKTQEREKIEEEKEELKEKIDEKRKFEQEIEKSRIMLSSKREAISGNIHLMQELKKQIIDLKSFSFDEKKITELESRVSEFKEQKEKLNLTLLGLNSRISVLDSKISENLTLKSKIHSIETCPTCLQNVDSVYKANVTNKVDSENIANKKELDSLNLEKKENSDKIKEISLNTINLEKEILDLKLLKTKLLSLEEKEKRLSDLEKINKSLEKDMDLLDGQIQTLKETVLLFTRYDNLFQLNQKELEKARLEERSAEMKVVGLKREIDLFGKRIEELKDEIEKVEAIKKELDYLNELEDWLSKKFSSIISFIEKNVMNKLRNEFSELFNKWFCTLVPSDFNAKLDEEFTPIIEQKDYELDYNYLSGGERTAVALAYRLALNQVINSMLSQIKTKDIVILDEPTDGFSSEQLDKMREVLQQLNVKQLILVSHEQKIEGFVENIIRFNKKAGITEVEANK